MQSEIIEGYFLNLDTGEEYLFQSQVDFWSEEAEQIHHISYDEMMYYPYKATAYERLLDWLPSEFTLISYVNMQTQFGFVNYDLALLRHSLMDHLNLDSYHNLPVKMDGYSVHTLAKSLDKSGLIDVPRKSDTNRKSFTQEAIYKYLFDKEYNAHRAKDDVLALADIYNKLIEIKESGKSIIQKNQLNLF